MRGFQFRSTDGFYRTYGIDDVNILQLLEEYAQAIGYNCGDDYLEELPKLKANIWDRSKQYSYINIKEPETYDY